MSNEIDRRDLGTMEGFTITAIEEYDTDTTPLDSDCYTPEDIEAWRDDKWHYSQVVVEASLEGVVLGTAYIGGLDTGYYWDRGDGHYKEVLEDAPGFTVGTPDGDGGYTYKTEFTFAHGYGVDLIAEAVSEAQETLARMINRGMPA